MIDCRVTIVGLGLMGGSLARALRGKVTHLTAVERHAASRQQALAEDVVDLATDDLTQGLRHADLVILATPVGSILKLIRELPVVRPDGCLVLDIGSVKEPICAEMSTLPPQFGAIGGHPMCGRETAGFASSDARLYVGCQFVLCRNSRTSPAVEDVASEIVRVIGAKPIYLQPEEHDELTAVVSHVPYLLSAALMHRAAAEKDERLWQISASGFRDSSRLAGSDPRMMKDILTNNHSAVVAQLRKYHTELEGLIELLGDGDQSALSNWLEEAQVSYHLYRKHIKGRSSG